MDRIGMSELNRNLSQVLARVSRGEVIEVTDEGNAVARLVPVEDDRSTLSRLVGAGRAVAPIVGRPVPPPPPQVGDRAVEVAAEERW